MTLRLKKSVRRISWLRDACIRTEIPLRVKQSYFWVFKRHMKFFPTWKSVPGTMRLCRLKKIRRCYLLNQKVLFSRTSLLHLDEPQIIYILLEFSVPTGRKLSTPLD